MDRLSLLDETLRAFDSSLPTVVSSRCVVDRYRASECRRCVEACPTDAVSLAPLSVDADRCIACGACAAVCRTGALDYPQARSLVHERLAAPAGSQAGGTAVVACSQAGGTAVVACSKADPLEADVAPHEADVAPHVVVACLAGLAGADVIAAAAAGRDRLVLLSGDCSSCPAGAAPASTDPDREQTAAWLNAAGAPLGLERRAAASTDAPMHPAAASVSRRDLFGLLLGRGRVVAAAALPSAKPTIEVLHAVTPPPAVHRRLIADLEALRGRAAAALPLPASLPLAKVEIGDGCDGCGLCTRYCPHAALWPAAEGVPAVDSRRCTGCGLCAETCPRGVVAVRPAGISLLAEPLGATG